MLLVFSFTFPSASCCIGGICFILTSAQESPAAYARRFAVALGAAAAISLQGFAAPMPAVRYPHDGPLVAWTISSENSHAYTDKLILKIQD